LRLLIVCKTYFSVRAFRICFRLHFFNAQSPRSPGRAGRRRQAAPDGGDRPRRTAATGRAGRRRQAAPDGGGCRVRDWRLGVPQGGSGSAWPGSGSGPVADDLMYSGSRMTRMPTRMMWPIRRLIATLRAGPIAQGRAGPLRRGGSGRGVDTIAAGGAIAGGATRVQGGRGG
jgi:hypothetical protein